MARSSEFSALLHLVLATSALLAVSISAEAGGRGGGGRSSKPPSPPPPSPPPPFNAAAEVQQVLATLKAGKGASFAAAFEESDLVSTLVDGINNVIATAPKTSPSGGNGKGKGPRPRFAYLLFVPTDDAFSTWAEPSECPTVEQVVRSHIVFLNRTAKPDFDGVDESVEFPRGIFQKGAKTLEPNTLIAPATPDVESKNITEVIRNRRGVITKVITRTVYTYFPKVKTVDATTLVDVPSSSARLIFGPTRVPATSKYILVQYINAVLSPAVDCGAPAPAPLGT